MRRWVLTVGSICKIVKNRDFDAQKTLLLDISGLNLLLKDKNVVAFSDGKIKSPPETAWSALRAANPKAARAATYRSFSLIWLQSTKNLEPISSAMLAESCRLSPNACPGKPALAPPEKPYVLFFEISPAEFLFSCKGCFWWFGYHFMAWVLIF